MDGNRRSDPRNSSQASKRGDLPDGGYGWVVVAASFLNCCILGGHMLCFAIFYYDIAEYFNVSLAYAGLIQSSSMIFNFFPGLLWSFLLSNLGCRGTTILGSLLTFTGYLLSYFAFSVPWLCLTYGCIIGSGVGMQYLATKVVVKQYFNKRHSIADGLALSGLSLGVVMMSYGIVSLRDAYTWRGTMVILGGICLNGCVNGLLYRPVDNSTLGKVAKTMSEKGDIKKATPDSINEVVCYNKTNDNEKPETSLNHKENVRGEVNVSFTQGTGLETDYHRLSTETDLKVRIAPTLSHYIPENTNGTCSSKNISIISEQTSCTAEQVNNTLINQTSNADQTRVYSPRFTRRRFAQSDAFIPISHLNIDVKKHNMSEYMVSEAADVDKLRVREDTQSLWQRSVTMMRKSVDFSTLKNPAFLLFCVGTLFTTHGFMIFYAHYINRAIFYGIPRDKLATLPTAIGLSTGTARILFGFVGNLQCVNVIVLLAVGTCLCGLVNIAYSFTTTYTLFVACGICFGLSMGILLSGVNPTLVKLLGAETLPQSLAILNIFVGVGALIAAPLAGKIYDITGNYDVPFCVGGTSLVFGSILVLITVLIHHRKRYSKG